MIPIVDGFVFSREQRAVLRAVRPEASIGRVGAVKPRCEAGL